MKYLDIKKGDLQIEVGFPETYNELTPKQVYYIAHHWRAWQWMLQSELDMQKARVMLFVKLAKTKISSSELCKLLSQVDFDSLDFGPISLIDFVFEKISLTNNPLKRFGFLSRFYGPDDLLKNISIIEFSYALHFYNRYNQSEDRKDLDLLIGCLYRKKAKDWEKTGDMRQEFNPNTADKYLKRISRLSYRKKEAVWLFFAGVMYAWSQKFPMVFSKADPKKTPASVSFVDVVLEMSGKKFGTFEQTQKINAYTFLKELNTNLVEALKKAKK